MHKIAPWHQCFTFIVEVLLCFLSVYFCFYSLRLVKAQIKTVLKADDQGITGYFQSLPDPNESRDTPFYFKIKVPLSNQPEKFETKIYYHFYFDWITLMLNYE